MHRQNIFSISRVKEVQMEIFWRTFIAGFLIAAPVGAVGVLCVQRTLISGLRSGLMTGFGAAIADTIYGAIASFGMVLVTSFVDEHKLMFRLLGAIVILALGFIQLFKKKKVKKDPVTATSLGKDFITTFFITLTNPITIFAFMAVFAASDMVLEGSSSLRITISILGVFCGAMTCWSTITGVAYLFRKKIKEEGYGVINKAGAVLILCFGVYLTVEFFREMLI